jgi:hypothetical protein
MCIVKITFRSSFSCLSYWDNVYNILLFYWPFIDKLIYCRLMRIKRGEEISCRRGKKRRKQERER